MKRAHIHADYVCVLCPHCAEAQPNDEGEEYWAAEDFTNLDNGGKARCVACDEPMLIAHETRPYFEPIRTATTGVDLK